MKITDWSPDTCDCHIQFAWDETVDSVVRVHVPTRVDQCDTHGGATVVHTQVAPGLTHKEYGAAVLRTRPDVVHKCWAGDPQHPVLWAACSLVVEENQRKNDLERLALQHMGSLVKVDVPPPQVTLVRVAKDGQSAETTMVGETPSYTALRLEQPPMPMWANPATFIWVIDDKRVLHAHFVDATSAEITSLQAAADAEFGVGKVKVV